MIDYDEMEAYLSQEEQKLAEEQAMLERDKAMIELMDFDPEDEGDFGEVNFVICDGCVKNVRNFLQEKLTAVRKEYDAVDAKQRKDRHNIWLTGGAIAPIIIFPTIVLIFYGKIVGWGSALLYILIWGFFVFEIISKFLNTLSEYRVRSSIRRAAPFIEANGILTYEKEKEYAHEKIKIINEHLEKVRVFERKLDRQHGLSESDQEELLRQKVLPMPKNRYTRTKVTFWDYLQYLRTGR